MNINEIYSSKALQVADLKGKDVTVKIAKVELAEFDEGNKPKLHFSGTEKTFITNKTNATAIASMYGPDTDNWIGKSVTLMPTQTDFNGRIVPCIRIKLETADSFQAPSNTSFEPKQSTDDFGSPAANGQAQSMEKTLDDEIPF